MLVQKLEQAITEKDVNKQWSVIERLWKIAFGKGMDYAWKNSKEKYNKELKQYQKRVREATKKFQKRQAKRAARLAKKGSPVLAK